MPERWPPGAGVEPAADPGAGDDRWTQVRRALAGERAVLDRLLDLLTPIVQARVARKRLAWGSGPVRQEVEDLVQEVFLVLFADDGKVLRTWDPQRGLSLENYVGLVAERHTISILRSGKRTPWREDPTLDEVLDRRPAAEGPAHGAVESRDQLRRLLRRLHEELSPLGRHLFDLLFLRDMAVAEAAAVTGMSGDALYAWRSRLRRLCQRLAAEPMSDPAEGERRLPVDRGP